jgi:ribokinase
MITVVGSLVVDIAMRVPRLAQAGEVVHGHDLQVACGGKGANQAYAAAHMGARTALIGIAGTDILGDAMVAALASAGVDTQAVVRRADMASGCFVVATNPQGQSEVLVVNGINGTLSAADVERQAFLLRQSQAVLAQLETSIEAVERALQIARAAGVLTVLNPAPALHFRPGLLALSDFVIVNEEEATSISGVEVRELTGAAEAARVIKALGAQNALVTLGAQGVWVDVGDAGGDAGGDADGWHGHIAGYPMTAVDSLGAGDTFAGTFVARLCEGADPRMAAQFATAAAAISVTRPGAQPAVPSRAEVEQLLAGTWK